MNTVWLVVLILTWHTNPPKIDTGTSYPTAQMCARHLEQAADIVCCIPIHPADPSQYAGEGFCHKPKVTHGIIVP